MTSLSSVLSTGMNSKKKHEASLGISFEFFSSFFFVSLIMLPMHFLSFD